MSPLRTDHQTFLRGGAEWKPVKGRLSGDEQRLAELGYKQELKRGWSGFSNFAISFSIISVLAGCFTTYGQAWNNGGPIAISIAWPVISLLILCVAFSMSELASAMPTAGGIYYWASKLGGPVWGWFTGWFNLVGLVAVVASVDYICASFLQTLLGLYKVNFIFNFASTNVKYNDHVIFALFVLILIMRRTDQRLLEPARVAVQPDLGVVARDRRCGDRRDPAAGPGPPPELLVRVRPPDQQLGLQQRHVLVLRPAARLPADDVHDHRLRRVGSPLRGDARRRQVCGQGRVAVRLLLGRDRLDRAAGDHLRGDPSERDDRERDRRSRSSRAHSPRPRPRP